MKKKIVTIFIIMLFLTITTLPLSGAINIRLLKNNWGVNVLFNSDPENVTLELDINGTVYGHELLWKANTTGTNYEESAVAYTDGIAYIGSCSTHGQGHDKLFAVNTTNGEIIWSIYTGPGYAGPVIDDDVLYFGTCSHGQNPDNEYMYSFDRFTGEEIWNVSIYGGISESVQYDEQKLYFCSNYGGEKVYALNKVDGSIDWTYDTGLYNCANKPMLKDNAFYAAYFENTARGNNEVVGELFKLKVSDGSLIWNISLSSGPWDNSITADGEGRIFLAINWDKSMNAYNETDGSLLWTYTLHHYSLSFNAYHNGVVFIADDIGYVYAIDSTDGSLIWENKIGDCIDISSPTIGGGLIFIGTHDSSKGAFFALNESTGEVLWKYNVGSSVTAPPSIADGMMLCGTDGWYMYAFDFGIGSGDWNLHRYDSYNTAYSPNGLTSWQNIEAKCTTNDNMTTCIVTNYYDHDAENIILKLDFNAYWYDSLGNLLKSDSDYYIIDNLSSSSSMKFIILKNPSVNLPPDAPSIDGPKKGNKGVSYNFTFNSFDPDGDYVYYYIKWGDGCIENWDGPHPSGVDFVIAHSYPSKKTFTIEAKAKDTSNAESNWTYFDVKIPRTRTSSNLWFQWFLEHFPILRYIFRFQ